MQASTYETTSLSWSDYSLELQNRLVLLPTVPVLSTHSYVGTSVYRDLVLEGLRSGLKLSPTDFERSILFFSAPYPPNMAFQAQKVESANRLDRLWELTQRLERWAAQVAIATEATPTTQDKVRDQLSLVIVGVVHLLQGLGTPRPAFFNPRKQLRRTFGETQAASHVSMEADLYSERLLTMWKL